MTDTPQRYTGRGYTGTDTPDDAVTEALRRLAAHDTKRDTARSARAAVPDALDPFADVRHPNMRAFLRAYALTGNKSRAATIAGIDRTTLYTRQWREDAEFREGCEVARQMASDLLEDEAWRRAVEGVDEPAGWYKGEPGGFVRKYSDSLMETLLRANRPDRYGNKLHVTGAMARLDVSRLPPHVLDALAEADDPSEVLNRLGRDVTKLLEASQGGDDGES